MAGIGIRGIVEANTSAQGAAAWTGGHPGIPDEVAAASHHTKSIGFVRKRINVAIEGVIRTRIGYGWAQGIG